MYLKPKLSQIRSKMLGKYLMKLMLLSQVRQK